MLKGFGESDARYGVGKFEGSYFWKGFREKGGSDEPPEPPLVTGLNITPVIIYIQFNCFIPYSTASYRHTSST